MANFNDFAVYNVRLNFSRQPGDPERCFHCGSPLSTTNIEPSCIVKDHLEDRWLLYTVHDFTLLHYCEKCHWWCVRESWSLCEVNRDLDYVIVGIASCDPAEAEIEKPWLIPMMESNYLQHEERMPGKFASIFKKED